MVEPTEDEPNDEPTLDSPRLDPTLEPPKLDPTVESGRLDPTVERCSDDPTAEDDSLLKWTLRLKDPHGLCRRSQTLPGRAADLVAVSR